VPADTTAWKVVDCKAVRQIEDYGKVSQVIEITKAVPNIEIPRYQKLHQELIKGITEDDVTADDSISQVGHTDHDELSVMLARNWQGQVHRAKTVISEASERSDLIDLKENTVKGRRVISQEAKNALDELASEHAVPVQLLNNILKDTSPSREEFLGACRVVKDTLMEKLPEAADKIKSGYWVLMALADQVAPSEPDLSEFGGHLSAGSRDPAMLATTIEQPVEDENCDSSTIITQGTESTWLQVPTFTQSGEQLDV
jgi:hypothetical protein